MPGCLFPRNVERPYVPIAALEPWPRPLLSPPGDLSRNADQPAERSPGIRCGGRYAEGSTGRPADTSIFLERPRPGSRNLRLGPELTDEQHVPVRIMEAHFPSRHVRRASYW